ncbi:hypothetical protein IHE49_07515 [Rhodanobacter sp. 7MK24]|uniref:hypothetical protein n=1 Tax=Rhodanobacter sp. 7MK24 TaxID=2775922 RepID=UPI001781DE4E|nr:hypothetical protein [Rhodanobacter sp. 7MK24]MBD8880325.1 hypothetical protein [Rhodanobacter sp. 7MK24]
MAEELKGQVFDGKHDCAKPMVMKIVAGLPALCRGIDSNHAYAMDVQATAGTDSDSPYPDPGCVAFVTRVAIDGHTDDRTLYAPNSSIASSH